MAPIPDKPYGLGVLDSFDELENGLIKIRRALAERPPDVDVAKAEVKDLLRDFQEMRQDATDAQKQVTQIMKSLRIAWVKIKRGR